MNSIWPQNGGYWALMTKLDSLGGGKYYYGAEVLLLDSTFEIVSKKSYGDTSKYYFEYPIDHPKTVPDGNGNYWYRLPGYLKADSSRHLFYGKFDALGNILFEKVLPATKNSDYFFDFLLLQNGTGLLTNTHSGNYAPITWLTWIDSLGNIIYRDSTERINQFYFHATTYISLDETTSLILAPSSDMDIGAFQIYDIRPQLRIYGQSGTFIRKIDFSTQLRKNYIGSIYPINNNGYVGFLTKVTVDTTAVYSDRQPGIVKFDSAFNVEWTKYLFPPKLGNEAALFHKSQDGSFFLAGRHDASPNDTFELLEWFITKFSPDLDSLWTRFYNIGGDDNHQIVQDPIQVHTQADGTILVLVGNAGGGWFNTTIYRLDSNGCLISGCNIGDTIPTPPIPPADKPPIDQPLPLLNGQLLAYPNPSTGQFNLEWDVWPGDHSELKIFDITSKTLLEMPIQREARPSVLDLSNWANGIYFLEIKANSGRVFRAKVLLQK